MGGPSTRLPCQLSTFMLPAPSSRSVGPGHFVSLTVHSQPRGRLVVRGGLPSLALPCLAPGGELATARDHSILTTWGGGKAGRLLLAALVE